MPFNSAPNLNCFWSSLIVEELVRNGVRQFCLAPGSRNALLIAAAARHPLARCFVHIDERTLGFYAMGYAAASRQPVAVIVTSGTAVANLLPSLIEASKKKLPIIYITADRPPELQKTGAQQTIDQEGIFSSYVRALFHLPCPDLQIPPSFILTTIDQAIHRSKGELSGPVHINCMYREPLSFKSLPFPIKNYSRSINGWKKSGMPFTFYQSSNPFLSSHVEPDLLKRIGKIKSGLIVAGKLPDKSAGAAILTLAEHLGWPVWPDITSGLRMGSGHPQVAAYFDRVLVSDTLASRLDFDGILHFGGRMTSKRFYQFAQKINGEYISVLSHPLRSDPLHKVTCRIRSAIPDFCRKIIEHVPPREPKQAGLLSLKSSSMAGKVIAQKTMGEKLTASVIARTISQHIPRSQRLFVSNSLPVREMDMFANHAGADITVNGNRGASGIDGIIASAAGYAAGAESPLTLFIGDLAFLYDLTALSILKDLPVKLIIVLVNNDGGGIFSHLPIAGEKDIFETFIAAPHGLTFRKAAELFSLDYVAPDSLTAFTRTYTQAIKHTGKSLVIECKTSRIHDRQFHDKLDAVLKTRLAKI